MDTLEAEREDLQQKVDCYEEARQVCQQLSPLLLHYNAETRLGGSTNALTQICSRRLLWMLWRLTMSR